MNVQFAMKAQQVKISIVALCVAALGWISWSFYDFVIKNKNIYLTSKFPKQIAEELAKLDAGKGNKTIERPKLDNYKILFDLNITGKESVIEKTGGPVTPAPPVTRGIKDILRVLYIQRAINLENGSDSPQVSQAYVFYTDPMLASPANNPYLKVGDHLPKPYNAVFLAEVFSDKVIFKYDNDEKPAEEVKIQEYDLAKGLMGSVLGGSGGGGAGSRTPAGLAAYPPNYVAPQKTKKVSEDEYWIGYEDAEKFDKSYQTVLRDVQSSTYFDPKLKKNTGIRIDSVGPNSAAYSYGVQGGDILKSINDNPVSTKEQAIQWVKSHPDLSHYWVTLERQGKDLTKHYYPPPKK